MNSQFEVDKGREIDLIIHEIAVMKQLIKERAHPLDLLRELVSNAAAREVGARSIKVSYHVQPDYGNVFQVADDGCGMDFTDDVKRPGRLDRFLGLGLSGVVGLPSDEFAWKGLGSKLAFQSRCLQVETWTGCGKVWQAVVNEPWDTIERGLKPRPKITQWEPEPHRTRGTVVKVYGHPPHWKDKTFTYEQIETFLTHRTFVGFTRPREAPPRIELAVLEKTVELPFGFQELENLVEDVQRDTVRVEENWNGRVSGSNRQIGIVLKGFYTWDEQHYGLRDARLNTGLVVSVNGIPYFDLGMKRLGSRQLAVATPGVGKCCLVVECDQIQEEMNISRSGLVDSALTEKFKEGLTQLIEKIENSPAHLEFRRVPEERKQRKSASELDERKRKLASKEQNWVFWRDPSSSRLVRLLREPENETDVLAILWKLEALGALPFKRFETLGYAGAGPDLIVHFQEDDRSDAEHFKTVEVEKRFYNYTAHGHLPTQYPTVICWNIGPTPKVRVEETEKKHKFVVKRKDSIIRIYTLRRIDGIFVSAEPPEGHP